MIRTVTIVAGFACIACTVASTAHADEDANAAEPPAPQAAAAQTQAPETPVTKKDRLLADKANRPPRNPAAVTAAIAARIGKTPAPLVNIFHTHTREFVAVDVSDASEYTKDRVNEFFRCHFTGKVTTMDPRLFAALVDAARHFNARRIDIVSAYRSDKYNLILRKKGREVARNSQHVLGNAVDFRVHGVSTKRLRAWARKRKMGGVGYYSRSQFIHMDVSRVRYWEGR